MGLKTVVISLVTATAFAQDSTYVKHINDKLSVQIFALNTSNDFMLDYKEEKFRIAIVPNQKTTLNVGVQYDIVSFSFGYAPSFFANNQDNKGSKMLAFSSSFYPGRFMQQLELYYQRGMMLRDADQNLDLLYLPQLKSLKMGGSTWYMLNRNFSFRAITLQNAKQLRSAGTFAPGISYYYTQLDGRDEPDLGDRSYFIDIAAEIAYYYNWVIGDNFLLAGGLSLGLGSNWTTGDGTYNALLSKAGFLLAPGFNSERWFGGAQFRYQYGNHESEAKVDIGDGVGYVSAYVGYRFDAPQFLQTQRNRVYNLIQGKQ